VRTRLHLRYFAAAKDAVGLGEDHLDFEGENDVSVATLRAAIVAHQPTLGRVLEQSRLAINMRFVKDGDVVDVGAITEIAVIPPVAGG
jgi:molybdopterin converting factor small subunit